MYTLSNNSKNHLIGVHPVLKAIIEESIVNSPYDFGVSEGVRGSEKQHQYYLDGKSNADGYVKKSYHQIASNGFGHAVDIYGYLGGLTYEYHIMEAIANHIKGVANKYGVSITWGGDWISFVDLPHFQIPKNTPVDLLDNKEVITNESNNLLTLLIFFPAIIILILWLYDPGFFKKLF